MFGRLASLVTPHGGFGFSPQIHTVLQRLIHKQATSITTQAVHLIKPRLQQHTHLATHATRLFHSSVGIHTGLKRTRHVCTRQGMDAVYKAGRRGFANFTVVQAVAPARKVGNWGVLKGAALQVNLTDQRVNKRQKTTSIVSRSAAEAVPERTATRPLSWTMDKEDSVVASTVDDALSWMDHVIEQDMATSPSVQSENEDVSPLDQAGATWTLVVDLPTLPQPSCDQVLTTDAILPLLADFEHVKHQMDTIIKLFRDGVLDSCGIQLQQQGQQLVLSCDKWTGAEGRLLLRRWLSKLGIDVTTVRIVPLLEKVPETREESVLARWRLGTESYLAHEHQSESMAFLAQLDALARPAFARKPPH